MRDAFGGTFMLKIAMVFFVIYICFMAMTLTYAKAFRVKNQVINIVEQERFSGPSDNQTISKIDTYLASVPYKYSEEQKCKDIAGGQDYTYTPQGACIISYGTLGATGVSSRYYKVVTFIYVKFPLFNLEMTLPISGETKTISSPT